MFKSSKSKKKSTTTEHSVEPTVVEGDGFTMAEPAAEPAVEPEPEVAPVVESVAEVVESIAEPTVEPEAEVVDNSPMRQLHKEELLKRVNKTRQTPTAPAATPETAATPAADADKPWIALKMTEGAWNRVQRRAKLNSGEIKK
jgi:hypothetical protein